MEISWADEKDLLQTGQFKNYNVWLNHQADSVNDPLLRTTPDASYTWSSLESAMGYQVRVTLVTNDFGESEKSGPVNFRTQENTDSEKSAIENLAEQVVST